MLVIDTEQTRGALSFEQAIPALREAFAQGAHVPARHVHAIESGGAHGTSLIMPAWNERGYFGVKVINIFPENTRQSLPGLHATYNLYSARSVPLAQVDGDIVTVFRTAGAAALGASYLARPDAAVLLIVGSGRIAGLLAQAMRAVRPIRKVLVWNLRAAGAQALAESCARRGTTRPRPGSGSGGAAGGHCQLRHLVHRAAGAWRLAATRHAPGPDRQLQARHDRNRHGLLRRHVRLCGYR